MIRMTFRGLHVAGAVVLLAGCASPHRVEPRAQWTPEQAQRWQASKPWLVGCNFSPSTAINELEMWQAETWDPATINRELGWAQDLGFNSVRVFLHNVPYDQDPKGFLKRMDQFLGLAHQHRIGVMFVLLDSCWDPVVKPGKQRAPVPHLHNSGWVQCPGKEILRDPARHDELKPYIQGVIGHFRKDPRVDCWDLFNEPDNIGSEYRDTDLPNKPELALLLIRKAYAWAREVNPSQPLTSAVWRGDWSDPAKLNPMEQAQLDESDVISFHNYSKLPEAERCVQNLHRYHRPILCTEYMARPAGSRFDPVLGYFKQQGVGAYNWGFVSGKTQTIYPWDSWKKKYTAEPPLWFHDILHTDGTPYDPEEVRYIKAVTGANAGSKAK
jgi:hypothetical protein